MRALKRSQLAHPLSERYSGRAMSGEPLAPGQLEQLVGAIRWAPSCNNDQPWRVFIALRDTPAFERVINRAMLTGNAVWCEKAAAVFVMCTAENLGTSAKDGRAYHRFDTGMATQNLLLEAISLGLITHPLAGFKVPEMRIALDIDPSMEPLCAVVVGQPGKVEDLPNEDLMRRERVRTEREPLESRFFLRED